MINNLKKLYLFLKKNNFSNEAMILKQSMPLAGTFDLHEDVQTNPKYLNALKMRLRYFKDNIYFLNYSMMYENKDPSDIQKEKEFVRLLKEFFGFSGRSEFIERYVAHGEKSLEDFIQFCKEKGFSFNGEFLHDVISNPKDATLIIRNVPDESLPSQDIGGGFLLNSFYAVHDALCHGAIELNSSGLEKQIISLYDKYIFDCAKSYFYNQKLSLLDYIMNRGYLEILADNINEEDEDKFVNGEVFIKELGRKYEDLNLGLIDADTLINLFKRSQGVYQGEDSGSGSISLLSSDFAKQVIKFPRKSEDDDLFCDFVASIFTRKIKHMLPVETYMVPAEKIYRYNPKTKTVDESMSDPIPFKPGPRVYDIREKFMSDLEKIKDGIDMKSLFKNKVIYHPFY